MYQYNPFSLEGKVILITGASSGIGRATAIECAKMGASLIITGRDEERLKETFAKLEGFKNKANSEAKEISISGLYCFYFFCCGCLPCFYGKCYLFDYEMWH